MSELKLELLSEPFHPNDLEWRVQKAEVDWCRVFPYLTARAVMARLDAVVGPENWCNTPLAAHEMRVNVMAVQVGISIRINGEWITKYDVSSPSDIEPSKGAYSGAMKRAGSQWGIGRYLSLLPDMYGVLSESKSRPKGDEWKKQTVKGTDKYYYWKPPQLPAWAMPKAREDVGGVTKAELSKLKANWIAKFAPLETSNAIIWPAFERFVHKTVGDSIHVGDVTCWTPAMVKKCQMDITATNDGGKGPSSNVPFE